MATQFEQTAELNRHVDATIPLTWAVRWKAIRPILPMLACCSVSLPLLGVGLLPPDQCSHETRSSRFTSKEAAKLKPFVLQTFASAEEFRRVMLAAGGGLTIMGAGLYFWGLSTPKRPEALAVSESAASADATPATATGGSIAFSR